MESIYNFTLETLTQHLQTQDCPHPKTAAIRIFHHLYRERKVGPLTEGQISKKAINYLAKSTSFDLAKTISVQESKDFTVKFLIEFCDGERVETVLIPFPGRYAVCISTQVGCAMRCSFCFTGTQGLKRHLTSGEILSQYLIAWEWLECYRPRKAAQPKIVLMGQGEPLHNFEEVKKALLIFVSEQGMQLGTRRITLSTAGYLPGLKRFGELPLINIALSLHSPFNSIRSQIIPLNKSYPLEDILATIDSIPFKGNRAINFEYVLIDGLNNREEDARELAKILLGKKGIINLIPFNGFPGAVYERPSEERMAAFQGILSSLGIHATIRTTKGSDIFAACGQLKHLLEGS
ncbi:MAG: 23S rRNA (adenine(2503)-C(2))-methyltransferase RlmN [Oligoflexia bacterium]|nr:23S rRNA (adenine(2503)-C(2))-methyltransferase RlmN [Oligoflexia bacterium]